MEARGRGPGAYGQGASRSSRSQGTDLDASWSTQQSFETGPAGTPRSTEWLDVMEAGTPQRSKEWLDGLEAAALDWRRALVVKNTFLAPRERSRDSSVSSRPSSDPTHNSSNNSVSGSEVRTGRPAKPSEPLPSIGTELHESGRCTPCHFHPRPQGCRNGSACRFCHLHGDEVRRRPCKATRAKAKSAVSALDSSGDPQELEERAAVLAAQGAYTRLVVACKLQQLSDSNSETDDPSARPLPKPKPPPRRQILSL
mmetsp:Transcript_54533/g.174912  ORF Transcript_54533/g.174912 Transcript_54533/m.174912 type:complete len:255 (-) Transcript_54533:63-827(-)